MLFATVHTLPDIPELGLFRRQGCFSRSLNSRSMLSEIRWCTNGRPPKCKTRVRDGTHNRWTCLRRGQTMLRTVLSAKWVCLARASTARQMRTWNEKAMEQCEVAKHHWLGEICANRVAGVGTELPLLGQEAVEQLPVRIIGRKRLLTILAAHPESPQSSWACTARATGKQPESVAQNRATTHRCLSKLPCAKSSRSRSPALLRMPCCPA